MIIEGTLFVANRVIDIKEVKLDEPDVRFSLKLEHALILLCKELDIPVPIWMTKNTHEFAAFRQTIFFAEQYTEKVRFDRFQIRMLQND